MRWGHGEVVQVTHIRPCSPGHQIRASDPVVWPLLGFRQGETEPEEPGENENENENEGDASPPVPHNPYDGRRDQERRPRQGGAGRAPHSSRYCQLEAIPSRLDVSPREKTPVYRHFSPC